MNLTREARAMLFVMLAAFVAYFTAVWGDFVYDDLHSVRDNSAIRSLSNLPLFFHDLSSFSSLDVRMYRPVLLASFAFDFALSGMSPWAFKLGNIAIHACCAALLYSLARRLRAQHAAALFVALLFAVHPLASEAVNMISSRSDQLMVFGLLMGMRCHMAAMAGSRWGLVGTAVAACIACGSKETGVILPVCLLILEGLRAQRRGWDLKALSLRLLPASLIVVSYLGIRRALLGVATASLPSMQGGTDVLTGAGRDLSTQLCTMAMALPKLIGQVHVPLGINLDPYVPYSDDWLSPAVMAGFVLIAGLSYFGLCAPRRRPAVFLGTCLAWGTALPWVILPLNLPVCEHRFYGPLAGLCLVWAAILPRRILRPRLGQSLAVGLLLVFATLSSLRSTDYWDRQVLWRKTLAAHPDSVRGYCGLALAMHEEARLIGIAGDRATFDAMVEEAAGYLERAISIHPGHIPAQRNLAEFNLMLGPEKGRPFLAVSIASDLVERVPDNPFYRLLLSRALAMAGQRESDPQLYAEAEAAALACLEIAEPKGLVYRTAATARALSGDLAAAIALLDTSVERGLNHKSVLLHRADLLLQAERYPEALRDMRMVQSRDPFDPQLQQLMQRLRSAAPR